MPFMRIFECPTSVAAVVRVLSFCLVFIARPADAQQRDQKTFQTDSVGNVKYYAPSWTVQPD
jgi:hypothetical protein